MKACTKCGVERAADGFYKSKQHGGLHPWCKDCARASQRAWRDRNVEYLESYRSGRVERTRQIKREAYWRDPEKARRQRRESSAKKRVELNARQRARYADPEYRERQLAREREVGNTAAKKRARFAYKMRKRSAPPTARAQAADACLRRDLCAYCNGPGGTLDHIIPLSGGGATDVDNLTGCCARCNSRKGAKSLLRFLADGGMLRA